MLHTRRARSRAGSWIAALPVAVLVAAGTTTLAVAPAATAATAATTVHVAVNAQEGLGTIPDTAFGLNTAVYDGLMTDAPVAGLLRSAGVGMLRYPGGSYGDIYHWQTNTADGGFVAPGTDFDSFMTMANSAGAQPIIIADYGSGTAQEAADWVRYANVTHHYGAKYWEIGNEVYGNGHYGASWEADLHADTSPAGYAHDLVAYATAMKAVDPSIRIGAVLTTPGSWPDGVLAAGDTADWNHTVLSIAGGSIDFVVVHWYPGGSSAADNLTKSAGIAGAVFTLRSLINQFAGANAPNVRIAVTETNATLNKDTQSAALFASDNYMTWLENGIFTVDWWDLHNGTGGPVTTVDGQTDYNDEGVLSNASCTAGVCEPAAETPFAPYFGIQMLTRLGGAGDQMVRAASDQPLVAAHAVRRADGDLAVLLVNTDPTSSYPVTLSYTGFTPAAGAPTVYSFGTGDTSIASAAQGTATTQTLPPYSLATVVLHPAAGGAAGPSAPGRPQVSGIGPDSATLTWSPSVPADPSTPVTGYTVVRQDGTTSTTLATSTATSATLTGLSPGTAYTVNVIGTDAAGRSSPPSDPVTFTTTTPVDSICAVDYLITVDWGGGFGTSVTITNTGTAPINGWTLQFDFPFPDQHVSAGWAAAWSQTGRRVTATDAGYNALLVPGASVQVGFNGGYTSANPAPLAFSVNGTVCTTTH